IEAELDPSMAGMALMLKSAEVNGKLVWRCVGRINALQRACTPGDGKAASIRAAGRTRPAATSAANRRAGNAADRPAAQGLSPEEREKRRTELQERLRKRRERRKANRDQREADRPGPGDDPSLEDDAPPDDDPIPGPDEEDLPIEEDLLDDEEFVDE
ncbi:MAG: hypothetical protein KC656_30430, partial [Myxococcales bacterium]|nr:hypothetical protein [Myxococcales bacterium]